MSHRYISLLTGLQTYNFTLGICLAVELFLMSSSLSVSERPATGAQMLSDRVNFTSGLAPPTFFLIFSFPTSVFAGAFSHLSLMYFGTYL